MVDAHGDDLFRYARRRVGDAATAEDLVQETFVAALQQASRFEARSAPRTWLIGILRHKIADHWRRGARTGTNRPDESSDVIDRTFDERGMWKVPPGEWSVDPSRLASDHEFWTILERCVEALPPSGRTAFTLRVMNDAEGEEICKAMGVSATNLWVILHRARLRLRACLEQHWFGGERDDGRRPASKQGGSR